MKKIRLRKSPQFIHSCTVVVGTAFCLQATDCCFIASARVSTIRYDSRLCRRAVVADVRVQLHFFFFFHFECKLVTTIEMLMNGDHHTTPAAVCERNRHFLRFRKRFGWRRAVMIGCTVQFAAQRSLIVEQRAWPRY